MTTLAEKIIQKMNVLTFNSNENNETDPYPTNQDYLDTIGYALAHGWTPNPKVFTPKEIEFIIQIEWEDNREELRNRIKQLF